MKTNLIRTLFNATCVISVVAVMVSGCQGDRNPKRSSPDRMSEKMGEYEKVRMEHQKDDYRCRMCDERNPCPSCGRPMHHVPANDAVVFKCPRCGRQVVHGMDWYRRDH